MKDDWLIMKSQKKNGENKNQFNQKRMSGLILLSVAWCAVLSQSRGSFQLEMNVRLYTSCIEDDCRFHAATGALEKKKGGRVAKDISDSGVLESCIIRSFLPSSARGGGVRPVILNSYFFLPSCLPSPCLLGVSSYIAQAPIFLFFPFTSLPPKSLLILVGVCCSPPFGADAVDCGGTRKQNKMVDGLEQENIKGRQMRPLVRGERVVPFLVFIFLFSYELTTGDVCPLWRKD